MKLTERVAFATALIVDEAFAAGKAEAALAWQRERAALLKRIADLERALGKDI